MKRSSRYSSQERGPVRIVRLEHFFVVRKGGLRGGKHVLRRLPELDVESLACFALLLQLKRGFEHLQRDVTFCRNRLKLVIKWLKPFEIC